MTTCEDQNVIETLWETIFSSSSREKPNRILPNLAHLLILCGALQQFQIEIASLAFGRTHWARNCVCVSPFKLLSVLPGFVYKRPRLDLVLLNECA
jgi:hypothetical protein